MISLHIDEVKPKEVGLANRPLCHTLSRARLCIFYIAGTYFLVIQQRDLQIIVESEPYREMNFYHQKDLSLTLQRFRLGPEEKARYLDDSRLYSPVKGYAILPRN